MGALSSNLWYHVLNYMRRIPFYGCLSLSLHAYKYRYKIEIFTDGIHIDRVPIQNRIVNIVNITKNS